MRISQDDNLCGCLLNVLFKRHVFLSLYSLLGFFFSSVLEIVLCFHVANASFDVHSEIDKHMDSINNLRRDKWVVEGQLRQ